MNHILLARSTAILALLAVGFLVAGLVAVTALRICGSGTTRINEYKALLSDALPKGSSASAIIGYLQEQQIESDPPGYAEAYPDIAGGLSPKTRVIKARIRNAYEGRVTLSKTSIEIVFVLNDQDKLEYIIVTEGISFSDMPT